MAFWLWCFFRGVFRWRQSGGLWRSTWRQFRAMSPPIWGAFLWIGWSRWRRNTSWSLIPYTSPSRTLIDSFRSMRSTGNGCSSWGCPPCSLLRTFWCAFLWWNDELCYSLHCIWGCIWSLLIKVLGLASTDAGNMKRLAHLMWKISVISRIIRTQSKRLLLFISSSICSFYHLDRSILMTICPLLTFVH